jgi:hypothetical protein
LYEKAMGLCSHRETKVFCQDGEIITKDIDKRYAPDTTAQIFWLKNRDPGRWKDKKEVAATVTLEDLLADAHEEEE